MEPPRTGVVATAVEGGAVGAQRTDAQGVITLLAGESGSVGGSRSSELIVLNTTEEEVSTPAVDGVIAWGADGISTGSTDKRVSSLSTRIVL